MESKSEGPIKFPAPLAAPLLILMAALAGGAALRESITLQHVFLEGATRCANGNRAAACAAHL